MQRPNTSRPAPSGTGLGAPRGYRYGPQCQDRQLKMYRQRHQNNWRHRISLAWQLFRQHAEPRLQGRLPQDIVVADIGCSIGTFAIEFAKAGYQSYGLDFDPAAIERARLLAGEEGVQPTFLCRNMLDPDLSLPPVDVAVCFDIFEHVHDDQLGSLLYALKRRLSPQGTIIFHTFPTYYDYIFYAGRGWHYPLLPFRGLPAPAFRRLTRVYATLLDALLLAKNGLNYRDAIADAGHCNPTTAQRLRDILRRSDYRILCLDTGRLFPNKPAIQRLFRKQPVADRHIFGVAAPFGEPSGPGGL